MSKPPRIVTEAQQAFTFSRRAALIGGIQLGVGAVLAGRMAWISIVQNEKYRLKAESNRVNLTLMPPRRGWIVDRNGMPLAINRTSYRVDIIPDRLTDPETTYAGLQQLMRLTPQQMDRIRADVKKAAGFQPVPVAENVDVETFAAVNVRLNDMPGVAPAQSFSRFYPDAAAVGHLLGYVGAASAKQYEATKDPLLITPGFKVGKEGLEKTLDAGLRGAPGAIRTEVTARGKLVRELATKPDVAGKTVKLTIDAGLQQYAARRMGRESGSVVVIDLENGGILAMASMPSYDPNSLSDGIGRSEWKMLQADDHVPLLNKSLQGLYPPGSTVKPIAALALQMNGVDPEETVSCGGGFKLGDRVFKCLGRHGPMNMRNAIMKSCNTYFYAMGNRIGYDKIAPIARMLGLGQEFVLPVASQRYGTVPDSAWKMKKHKKEWSRADTLNATIGQGYVQVSPLQLAVVAARIASGKMLIPTLIAGQAKAAKPLPIPPEFLQVVREGMDRVVNANGTATRSRLNLPNIRMGGKTGTAQVRKIEGRQRGGVGMPWKYRDHGLFVCFAPVDQPRYAAAVVVEHGLGGAKAGAPVAKDVLTYLFDPERANATLASLEGSWGGDIKTRMAKQAAAWEAANNPNIEKTGSVEDAEVTKEVEEKKEAQPAAPITQPAAPEPETANEPSVTPEPIRPAPAAPPPAPSPVPAVDPVAGPTP